VKTEAAIKNEQSRDTGSIGYKIKNKMINTKSNCRNNSKIKYQNRRKREHRENKQLLFLITHHHCYSCVQIW